MATPLPIAVDAFPTRVIAVTSGKGGVGKSTISINLAVALAQMGRSVTLLDADLGLANVHVMLGLQTPRNLADVLDGRCSLDEIAVTGPHGIQIIPGASGIESLAELGERERTGLLYAFSEIENRTEFMIVDTSAGIGPNSLQFCDASQEVIVVVCDDPSSITDAYATIKVLNQRTGRDRFRVVVNQVRDQFQAGALFKNLLTTAHKFLNVSLDFAGAIPLDNNIRASLQARSAFVESYPGSPATVALHALAEATDRWCVPSMASGNIEFFVERMIHLDMAGRRIP